MKINAALSAAVVVSLIACADNPSAPALAGHARNRPSVSALKADATTRGLDDEFREIARSNPAFAGFYFDSSGALVINEASADDRTALLALVRSALGRGNHSTKRSDGSERPIRFAHVQYTFQQLNDWRDTLERVIPPGLVAYFDADEGAGTVTLGVPDPRSTSKVMAAIDASGVPRKAVRFVRAEFEHLTQTQDLFSRFRPVMGGSFIDPDNDENGTLGVGVWAEYNGTQFPGLLTAGHVGYGSLHFQQGSSAFVGSFLGVGSAPSCDGVYYCYQADVGLYGLVTPSDLSAGEVMVENWVGARIARPDGLPHFGPYNERGTYSLYPYMPYFRVQAVYNWPVQGQIVNKVGTTTGWQQGAVYATCVTVTRWNTWTLTWDKYLCQDKAYINQDFGDSGAPVFVVNGDGANVTLVGIAWGADQEPPGGTTGTFSNWTQILKQLTVNTGYRFSPFGYLP